MISQEAPYFIGSANLNQFYKDRNEAAKVVEPALEAGAQSLVDHYNGEIKKGETWLEGVNKNMDLQHKTQKWGFFFGVLCLIVSYATPIICSMFHESPAVKAALISLQ